MGNSAGVLGMLPPQAILFVLHSAPTLAALGYNGINSTIDAVRGKHDAFGSMAAGAITGALFKSTGEQYSYLWPVHVTETFYFLSVPSWGEACLGYGNYGLSICGGLELGKNSRLRYILYAV